MTHFLSRFRVESTRHQVHDYHAPGWYFITVCTHKRFRYFGEVVNHQMQLSSIGKITYTELLKTQEIRNNVVIDEWVIMPDHIHMIIRIVEPPTVETHCSASLHPPPTQPDTPPKNRFGPQSNNIPAIVRGIKSAVKRKTNAQSIEFQWQARYHDHIIRGQAELERIRRYIKNNVVAWGNDARDK